MAHNAEEWRRLRSEFIEAAAKYDEYETFIERTAQSEDWYYNNGRYLPVGLIRWPYEPYRKCWIFAPDSGTNEEPFSTMKTLFSKAWLWLPRVIADAVLDTAEMHLSEPPSPSADTALFWANSHYQYWCWLLWFHWLRQRRRADPAEAERPSQKMVLAPFHCSADLIAQWGLDGSDGTLPDWLSLPTAPTPEEQPPAAKPPDAAASGANQDGDARKTAITCDVFLSYNSKDRRDVETLADMLSRRLKVWMDKKRLSGGDDWQDDIGEGIDYSSSFVVCIGPTGLGPCQTDEITRALKRKRTDPKFPIIPVLLPGAPDEPNLPFGLDRLDRFHRRTFRDGFNDSELQRLIRDINPAAAYPTPDNYERDKWIYEQSEKGLTIPSILAELENYARDKRYLWAALDWPNSIREAVKRYAKYAELPVPKKRPGKPRGR